MASYIWPTTTCAPPQVERRVDAVVARLPFSTDELEVTILYGEPRVLLVPLDHRLAGKESATVDDIADEPVPQLPARTRRGPPSGVSIPVPPRRRRPALGGPGDPGPGGQVRVRRRRTGRGHRGRHPPRTRRSVPDIGADALRHRRRAESRVALATRRPASTTAGCSPRSGEGGSRTSPGLRPIPGNIPDGATSWDFPCRRLPRHDLGQHRTTTGGRSRPGRHGALPRRPGGRVGVPVVRLERRPALAEAVVGGSSARR
ncbi:LysR substrate-binding domain-containing protein [Streptomyces sp. L7]